MPTITTNTKFKNCTKIKDKNGIMLYEGDYVIHPNLKCGVQIFFGTFNFEPFQSMNDYEGSHYEKVAKPKPKPKPTPIKTLIKKP